MKESNGVIVDSYKLLFEMKMVYSHNQFSREFLRKSSRYMSWICANNHRREPSVEVCVSLYIGIMAVKEKLIEDKEQIKANRLNDLEIRLWKVITNKSVKPILK